MSLARILPKVDRNMEIMNTVHEERKRKPKSDPKTDSAARKVMKLKGQ